MSTSVTPKLPRGLNLLGRDPGKGTYHWEGPYYGMVWETAPHKLYGWLKPWTDYEPEDDEKIYLQEDGRASHYLMNPETEDFSADEQDADWALVVSKADGRKVLRIRREFLFGFTPSPLGTVASLSGATSPYAFAGAIMRGEC